jgi:Mg-chelatase subunit ChlD
VNWDRRGLAPDGKRTIGRGLRVGAQVLVGRRKKNFVAGMILLSDGQDTSGCLGRA